MRSGRKKEMRIRNRGEGREDEINKLQTRLRMGEREKSRRPEDEIPHVSDSERWKRESARKWEGERERRKGDKEKGG